MLTQHATMQPCKYIRCMPIHTSQFSFDYNSIASNKAAYEAFEKESCTTLAQNLADKNPLMKTASGQPCYDCVKVRRSARCIDVFIIHTV